MKLSVIVPVYNKASILDRFLRNLDSHLKECDQIEEIILVNDGSTDSSELKINEFEPRFKKFRKLYLDKNRGKGEALKLGISIAEGDYVLLLDCGFEISMKSVIELYKEALQENIDIGLPSRFLKDSMYKASLKRRFVTTSFLVLRSILFRTDRKIDTQIGLKLFRKSILDGVLDKCIESRWLLDLEILELLNKDKNLLIKQTPVELNMMNKDDSHSTSITNILKIVIGMLKLSIRVGRLNFIKF